MTYSFEKIFRCINLGNIIKCCCPTTDSIISSLANHIVLNDIGIALKNELTSKYKIKDNDITVGIFATSITSECLIDLEKTDLNTIVSIINSAIKNGTILFPWIFDSILYNKYFNCITQPSDKMSCADFLMLLNETPQGVFQFGDIVVGPLGALPSLEKRNFRPKSLILWHCENPGCNQPHSVSIELYKRYDMYLVPGILEDKIDDTILHKLYHDIIFPVEDSYNEYHLGDLPYLLGHCFDETELRIILENIISNNQQFMRKQLATYKNLSGSASDICASLKKNECLQLILLNSSTDIIKALEFAIEAEQISIPVTEIRKPPEHDTRTLPLVDAILECSRFGVRTQLGGENHSGIRRLMGMLESIYSSESELGNLAWRLGTVEPYNYLKSDKYGKLFFYVNNEDISTVIEKLIFSDINKIYHAVNYLQFGYFNLSPSRQNVIDLKNKILWKLGFNINSFPKEMMVFWERYDKFLHECSLNSEHDEKAKEEIRGKSINFFISLEAILKRSLTFMCWVLLSAHYHETQFRFDYQKARPLVHAYLNGYKLSEDRILNIDLSGNDTLYPLIEGFRVLSDICSQLLQNKDSYLLPESSLPCGYNQKISLFPFLHKHLILDLETEQANNVINILNEISILLKKSNACAIRNSTSHEKPSEEFPSPHALMNFFAEIKNIVTQIEDLGVFPLLYLGEKVQDDFNGRQYCELKNYRGKKLAFYTLDNNYFLQPPQFLDYQIVVPMLKLMPYDIGLRFFLTESSNYTKMWEDYPKRRPRV